MSDVEFKKLANEMRGRQRQSSSILLLTIITLLAVLFTWASVTELDKVTRGSGKAITEANNQLVQSAESGVLRRRYVSEGDLVSKGDLLFDIDPVEATTKLDQAQQRFASLKIKSLRLIAEVENTTPDFPSQLVEDAPGAVATELALYKARRDDLDTKSAILEQRRLQKLNELQGLKIQYQTAINGLELIRREIKTVEPLTKKGLAPETRLISLQREEEDSLGRANAAKSGQDRMEAGLDEIDEQLKAEKQAYLTSALTDLSPIESEMAELLALIPALENRVERTTIRSPVDGIINRINYVTDDAFVQTGEVLLEIVPTGADLIIEAKIDPKDIAEIVEGQKVKISLTAYDPSKYGRLDGKVLSVSADAITDNDRGGARFYFINVSIDSELYDDDGSAVNILPGMDAQIEILSGKRSVLDYFWQPLLKTRDKAFTD